MSLRATDDGMAVGRMELRVKDKAEVDRIIRKVNQISGVLHVTRPAK